MTHPSPVTYAQLRIAMADKLRAEHRSPHSLDNLNAALRAYCAQLGLREDDVIGSELRASYYKTLAVHLEALTRLGRHKAYLANRKSYLSAWHRLVLAMDKQAAAACGTPAPLQTALQELVRKAGSQRLLATEAGIGLATLKRWLAGARPGVKSLAGIRRLERFCGLAAETLVELAFSNKPHQTVLAPAHRPIAYRERLRVLSKQSYVLHEVRAELRREWQQLLEYKTSIRTGLKARNRAGKWRVTESQCRPDPDKAWYAYFQGRFVPTAAIAWTNVARYLGWLQLPHADGGLQLPPEQAQQLSCLVRDDWIEQYLTWKIQRSGGIIHSGIATFARFVRGLVHPDTGYLALTPPCNAAPNGAADASWPLQCARCFQSMKELQRHFEEQAQASRDPFEPIRSVLALANPLEAVADMIFRMQADRRPTSGTYEAIWARDVTLIKLLMSNPLRIKNLQELTWRPDNTGQLHQRMDGSWHIKIERKYFKNHRGAARDRDYDNPVDPSVWPMLQQYLTMHRPRLLSGRTSDYVFVSHETSSDGRPWTRMGRRVFFLTKKYLWGCPGVGPHAFRHIVATAILKTSPNDWQTAALVLHDRVETVQQHYAHLRSADGTLRMHHLFERTFARA